MDFLDNFDTIFGPPIWNLNDNSEEGNSEDEEDETRFYRQYPRIDYLNQWNENEFIERFRLSKNTIIHVLSLIETNLKNHNSYRKRSRYISPMLQLLIAVRYYATGTFQIAVGDMCSVSRSSVTIIVRRVSIAIASLCPRIINMPTTDDELARAADEMYRFGRFPKCIGSIDCTHIKIQSPGGDGAEYYRNRKGWFSLNVQTISSANLKVLDIVCRWPGSTHDQTILNNSPIKARFEAGQFKHYCLIGDMGYANTSYLATPLLRYNSPVEQLYNESCIRTRNCVERKYGVLKRRFPCLSRGMQFKKFDTTQYVVIACAVLHNIAIDSKDRELELDPELEREIAATVNGLDEPIHNNNNNNNNIRRIRDTLIHNYFQRLVQ